MESINEENRGVIVENRSFTPVFLIKVLIAVLFMSPLIHYSIYQKKIDDNVEMVGNLVDEVIENRSIVKQPSCLRENQRSHLKNITSDLYLKQQQCSPDDFTNLEKHKLPTNSINNHRNSTTSESRGMIISCFIGGLLLTSLIAAIIELYKAKHQQYSDDNKQKLKTLMNRKCSLADLTVLKHNRKELMRRDSIMDIPEMGSTITTNNKQLMGVKPAPLHRRSSFPVGPHEFTVSTHHRTDYRRPSINTTNRRLSTTDNSRRNSLIIDSRRSSIDCRRISIDDSPERRHWSRLVHR